jgi:hypothetical protein
MIINLKAKHEKYNQTIKVTLKIESPALTKDSFSILISSSAKSQVPFVLDFAAPSPSLISHLSSIKSIVHYILLKEVSLNLTWHLSVRPIIMGA